MGKTNSRETGSTVGTKNESYRKGEGREVSGSECVWGGYGGEEGFLEEVSWRKFLGQ